MEDTYTIPLLSGQPPAPSAPPGVQAASSAKVWMHWVTPILTTASSKQQLEPNDLMQLDPELEPTACGAELRDAWKKELQHALNRNRTPSLLRAASAVFYKEYAFLGAVKFVHDGLGFVGPFLLKALVDWIAAPMPLPPQPPLPPPPFSPPWPEDAAALTEPSQALAQDEWAGAAAYHVANNGGSGLLCGEGSGGGMSERWACLAAWLQHGAELVLQLLQELGPSGRYFGFSCVVGLAFVSVARAALSGEFNWKLSRMQCQLRAGLGMCLYNKALLVKQGAACETASTAKRVRSKPQQQQQQQQQQVQVAEQQTRLLDAWSVGRTPQEEGAPEALKETQQPQQPAPAPQADVSTLMSVDTGQAGNILISLQELWSLPCQILVALCLLYTQVRWAFAAGLVVALLLVPINQLISRAIVRASVVLMRAKDARVAAVGEMLRGARAIKMLSWEEVLASRISKARKKEVSALAVRKYLDALCVYFWAATSLLFTCLTFGLVAALRIPLTVGSAFTALSLFQLLIMPLNALPPVINGVLEALISFSRLEQYLSLPEHSSEQQQQQQQQQRPEESGHAVCAGQEAEAVVLNASFSWNAFQQQQQQQQQVKDNTSYSSMCLRDITLCIPRGKLTVVVGDVGSGKSSLLAALRGELHLTGGRMLSAGQIDATHDEGIAASGHWLGIGSQDRAAAGDVSERQSGGTEGAVGAEGKGIVVGRGRRAGGVDGGVAYVQQTPWVTSGTIRDNILLGRPMDLGRYLEVLDACCLWPDLQVMPSQDLTWVAARGASLSGGQRARLALARALYQRCSVFLLDDILAALDARTAALITAKVLVGTPASSGGSTAATTKAAAPLHSRKPSTDPYCLAGSTREVPSMAPSDSNLDLAEAFGGEAFEAPFSEAADDSAAETDDVGSIRDKAVGGWDKTGAQALSQVPKGTSEANAGGVGAVVEGAVRGAGSVEGQTSGGVEERVGVVAAAAGAASGRQKGLDAKAIKQWQYAQAGADVREIAETGPGLGAPTLPLLHGTTVMLVTQSARCIAAADQVVHLSQGQLAFAGPPAAYFEHLRCRQGAENHGATPPCTQLSGRVSGSGMQQLNSHGSQPEVTGSRSTESKGDDMTVLLGLEAHGAAVDAHAPFVSPVAAQSPNPQALLKTTPSPSVRTAAPAPPPTASTSHAVTGLCTSASPAADVLPASAAPGALMPPPSPPAAATAAAGGRPAMGGGGALLSEGYAYEEAPPDEERECGAVSRPVYDFYLSAVGWGLVGLVLGSLVAMQVSKVANDLWVSHWMAQVQQWAHNHQHRKHQHGSSNSFGTWLGSSGWQTSETLPPGAAHEAFPGVELSLSGEADNSSSNGSLVGGPVAYIGRSLVRMSGLDSRRTWGSDTSTSDEQSWEFDLGKKRHPPEDDPTSPEGVSAFVRGLITIGVINAVCTLVRSFSFAKAGLRAAKRTHNHLLEAVLKCPVGYLDALPPGRILSRFSSDLFTIDDSLPFTLNIFLAQAITLLSLLAIMCYASPLLVVLLFPLAFIYRGLQRCYRGASREVRRLESLSLSPIYSDFAEVADAAPSLRALRGAAGLYSTVHAARMAAMQRASITRSATAVWLSIRLQLLASLIITCVALLAVAGHMGLTSNLTGWLPHMHVHFPGAGKLLWATERLLGGSGVSSKSGHGDGGEAETKASLAGLSLVYALPLLGVLEGLLSSSAETEAQMVAVERVRQLLADAPQERDTVPALPTPPPAAALPPASKTAAAVQQPGSALPPRWSASQAASSGTAAVAAAGASNKLQQVVVLPSNPAAQSAPVPISPGAHAASLPQQPLPPSRSNRRGWANLWQGQSQMPQSQQSQGGLGLSDLIGTPIQRDLSSTPAAPQPGLGLSIGTNIAPAQRDASSVGSFHLSHLRNSSLSHSLSHSQPQPEVHRQVSGTVTPGSASGGMHAPTRLGAADAALHTAAAVLRAAQDGSDAVSISGLSEANGASTHLQALPMHSTSGRGGGSSNAALPPLPPPPLPRAFPPGVPAAASGIEHEVVDHENAPKAVPTLALELREVYVRYREGGTYALAGTSCGVAAGERVAVVGRTGAGKSSLIAALLRLVNIESGKVLLHGIETRSIPLARLRPSLCVVPQTPLIISGTIRDNLDPFGRHRPRDIERALKATTLWPLLEAHVLVCGSARPRLPALQHHGKRRGRQQQREPLAAGSRSPSLQARFRPRFWQSRRMLAEQHHHQQDQRQLSSSGSLQPSAFARLGLRSKEHKGSRSNSREPSLEHQHNPEKSSGLVSFDDLMRTAPPPALAPAFLPLYPPKPRQQEGQFGVSRLLHQVGWAAGAVASFTGVGSWSGQRRQRRQRESLEDEAIPTRSSLAAWRKNSLDELALPLLNPIASVPPNRRKSRRHLANQESDPLQSLPSTPRLEAQHDQEQQQQQQHQVPQHLQEQQQQVQHQQEQRLHEQTNQQQQEQQQEPPTQQPITAFKSTIHPTPAEQPPAKWDILEQVLQLRMGGPAISHTCGGDLESGASSGGEPGQDGSVPAPSIALSHGQQQLLCLARMLLMRQTKPRAVVLLDEITSSVDPGTARIMHEVLEHELRGATVLQVAHNLSSIKGYDRILVMEEGQVVEAGTPEELLADPSIAPCFAALHADAVGC